MMNLSKYLPANILLQVLTIWGVFSDKNLNNKKHNTYPITHQWSQGMGCLLWVQNLLKFNIVFVMYIMLKWTVL